MPPPRKLVSLNGIWEVAPGDADTPPARWTSRVEVPSLVDTAHPPYQWRDSPYHWHRRQIALKPAAERESVFLILEQAMYGTQVWLDGRIVGQDISCYASQEHDLSVAISGEGEHELLIRVGARATLPPESAAGNDQEREDFIPGIWGDTWILRTGNPRIRRVQVIPRIAFGAAEVRVFVQNTEIQPRKVLVRAHGARAGESDPSGADGTVGPASGLATASAAVSAEATIPGRSETVLTLRVEVPDVRLWSPEDPFMYGISTDIESDGVLRDCVTTSFGMREFRVEGGDFLLNGRKILLRGGNIAFHRFLSDAARGRLPWDLDWARRVLIDIPKAHHFNFFRVHLGQMYNRWYDLADRHGMLLQNEWPFWTRSGSEAQIRHEFRRWLEDNWNHPSIVLWDPMNESHDEFVAGQLVSEMKEYDPTRAWEMRDFVDDHPYIYSLGPVLTDRKFGFSRALEEIEQSATPSVVNEFLWWWLDPDNQPTRLTREVMERWLGPSPGPGQLIAHQSFLAQELIELFRRMGVDAIQPFVYLSNGQGPTGHWFLGDIAGLVPKAVLAAIGNSLFPFGVSIELWDRHFVPGERLRARIFVFNDRQRAESGQLKWGIVDGAGAWVSVAERSVTVEPVDRLVVDAEFELPGVPGEYSARAELAGDSDPGLAVSRKPVFVVPVPLAGERLAGVRVGVLEESGEILRYLRGAGVSASELTPAAWPDCDIVLVADGLLRGATFHAHASGCSAHLTSGRTLVLVEPEFGVEAEAVARVTADAFLEIKRREDPDRGGYDSYVFMEDPAHPLWRGISPDQLKFFNGGFGGEIVSQHDVSCTVPMTILARCGLKLAVTAVAEFAAGGGLAVLSRMQVRGRLTGSSGAGSLYSRRPDPVAQRFLLNILEVYGRRGAGS